MERNLGLTGFAGWIAHRLFANYWMLAVCAVIVAVPIGLGILWLDREAATAWLLANDLATVATSDTAKDFAGVAVGINAAFITLYFSITLIVLSLAAGNLGVRLIDRWVERPLVRVSIAGLSFCLVVSLIAMLSIDGEAPLEDTPLLLVGTVFVLQLVNVAMLAVSLHNLARTMLVDTSIDRLATDASSDPIELVGVTPPAGPLPHRFHAPREGYVEDADLDALRKCFGDGTRTLVLRAAPGQHVLEGQVLAASDAPFDDKDLSEALPIGAYRSNNQGPVFCIRLLVEIAARALSPAINDFYTALACADKLAAVMESQRSCFVPDGTVPAPPEAPWLIATGQDFRSLFEDPMNAFRQAACKYPSVSIRMIGNYGRVARRSARAGAPDGMPAFLERLARELRDHAVSTSSHERDRADIRAAFAEAFEAREKEEFAA